MNTEKRPLRIGLIVLAVVAVALSGWWALSRTTGTEVAAGGSTGEGLPAGTTAAGTTTLGEDEIAVVEARPGSISITVEGPAVVEPFRELAVRSGIAGTIVEATTVGDSVVAGDVLARFDGTTFRAALEQARLNLEQARVEMERAELALRRAQSDLADKESLFSSGSITRNERDAARESVAAAELEVTSARIRRDQSALALETATTNLAATEVRAPYAGVVLAAQIGPGDVVTSGTVLMTFADLTRLRVIAEVDEFDVGRVEPGMPVVITADSIGDEEVMSTVERVSPAAEIINNISIFTVSAVVRADQARLRPGMSADLTVLVSDDTGLIVPSTAVSTVRGRAYLDVYRNEAVETLRVVAGTDDGRNTVILEGLEENDLVVVPVAPGFTLTTGTAGASGATGTSIIPIQMPGAGGSR
jgi:HlyD family secretion protein